MNALYWINQPEKNWPLCISRKVEEIWTNVGSACIFQYVPTNANPADLLSHGVKADILMDPFWLHGPEFLLHPDCSWESFQPKDFMPVHEIKSSQHILATTVNFVPIVEFTIFSCFGKLNRVMALVIKFSHILLSRVGKSSLFSQQNDVTLVDFATLALKQCVRQVQHAHFANELCLLKKGKCIGGRSKVKNLNLFLDKEDILRCSGRFSNSHLSYCSKYPILLPCHDYFVTFLISNTHWRVLHNGVKDTLNQLRSHYWIIRGRQAVRSVVHKCITCRKVEGASYPIPESPSLPSLSNALWSGLTSHKIHPRMPLSLQ